MTERMSMVKAINAGLRRAMAEDDKVLVAGEDVGSLGGVFRVTEGLLDQFGERRVLDTPLAEAGIIGTAVGMALRGYRPVLEIQFDGFVFPGFSQLVTQAARMHFRTRGARPMPLVVRIPCGGNIGGIEHHSESPESYFVHSPGLRVVSPTTPHDAYWMIQQAIRSDDPVVFLEPKRRYQVKGEVDLEHTGLGLHQSHLVRPGDDVTLIGYGPSLAPCLEAAELAQQEGTSVAVVDLRSLSPLDMGPVVEQVRATTRAVVVHEAPQTLGVGAEVAAILAQELYYVMEAPVLRVAGADMPYPVSKLEHDYLPTPDRILHAIDQSLAY